MHAVKKPWLAFVMSFIVPGAGLCYLEKWAWGILNFAVVQLILVSMVLAPVSADVLDLFHYVLLILAAGSAGIAHAVASQSGRSRWVVH